MVLSIQMQRILGGYNYASGILVIPVTDDIGDHLDDTIECCATRFNMVRDTQLRKIE